MLTKRLSSSWTRNGDSLTSSNSNNLNDTNNSNYSHTIALVSASSMDEKIDPISDSWDMSEDGALDLDEFTISLKSTLSGLSKIFKPTSSSTATKHHFDAVSGIIDEQEVDLLADRIFREIANVPPSSSDVNQISITCEQFREYCTRNKTAKNLFEFFDLADASSLGEDDEENDNALFSGMNEEARLVRSALAKARVPNEAPTPTVDIGAEDHGNEFLAVKPWKDAIVRQNIRSDALVRGHFHGELWGLDIHPHKQQCCTVGDDQMLRIWGLDTKKELRSVRLDGPGRACAYSSDGKLVAVGLGTDGIGTSGVDTKGSKQGSSAKNWVKAGGGFVVYSENDLTKMKEPCYEPRKWVSDVKFSPDNRVLAVASHDTKIYFYDVLKGFTKKQVFKKHSSYVTHIDFSSDGNYMQSTCDAYELLFSEVKTARHITGASTFRDERWHTMTSTLGWSVQGIWEEESDDTDVNSVDRSKDGNLLATGDDFGKVKVFRYPCALEKASSVELRGHASHVTNVRWSPHDLYIVSVGGNDRCVFAWKHEKPGNKAVEIDSYEDDDFTPQHAVDSNQDARTRRDSDPLEMASAIDNVGDEFMAVKPWLGAVVAPSNASATNLKSTSPDAYLELERVHGYQAQNAANNARYDSNGRIICHGAALGIIYDKSTELCASIAPPANGSRVERSIPASGKNKAEEYTPSTCQCDDKCAGDCYTHRKMMRVVRMMQNIWYLNNKSAKRFRNKVTTVKLFRSGRINLDHVNNHDQAVLIRKFILDMIVSSWDKVVIELYARANVELVDWDHISAYQNLSEEFLREFKDRINLRTISFFHVLSERFICDFANELRWDGICSREVLSLPLLIQFANRIEWLHLAINQSLTRKTILYFREQLQPTATLKQRLRIGHGVMAFGFPDNVANAIESFIV
ncbi:Microtubule-associated protein, partial [Globisporangium splendens]